MSDQYLRARGKAMWTSFNGAQLPAGKAALLLEACRLADALDKLDGILGGRRREWAKLVPDDMGEITLVVDGLLSERRQQQLAFGQIMDKLRAAGVTEADAPQVAQAEDELTRLRREKAERESRAV